MADAKLISKEVERVVKTTQKEIVLTLSEDEARFLTDVLGVLSSRDSSIDPNNFKYAIWDALKKQLNCPYSPYKGIFLEKA